MKCTKKGNISSGREWTGTCYRCKAEFKANQHELTIQTCPREHYQFANTQCPECKGNTLTMYPKD